MAASGELAEDIRDKIMHVLKIEEDKTDLDNLTVLSKIGLKVASSTSSELDADTTSASSSALIDLGLRLSEATQHGSLMEILLHNAAGYSILMAINEGYIVFGGLRAYHRIGYYLGYLRDLVKKLNILLTGGEISEATLSFQEEEQHKKEQKIVREESIAAASTLPSIDRDKAAMDELLGYLDEWDQEEKEAMGIEDFEDVESDNIVSIPKSMMVGIPKEGESLSIPEETLQEVRQSDKSQFKLYEGEVPPIPLEEYTPMDVEEQATQETEYHEMAVQEKVPKTKTQELPSLDALAPPDFDKQLAASEYETSFILEEESEKLKGILEELGWEEED